MRIAIITLPLHTNYGGILQAYALQTVLERMGHEVRVITRSRIIPIGKRAFIKGIWKFVHLHDRTIFDDIKRNYSYRFISYKTEKFISKHINQDNRGVYEILENDYDAFVVGSDQVWRPLYSCTVHRNKMAVFLDFTSNWAVRRISYAASFGSDIWEYTNEETEHIKKYIKNFNAVSIREYSGKLFCNKYLGLDVEQLLDPTLLLNSTDYIHLANLNKKKKGERKRLFCYILDNNDNKTAIVDEVSRIFNLKVFYGGSKVEDENALLKDRIQPSVELWIKGFYDADFVVTDSFHGSVFSFIFHKPFIVIGNEKRGLSRLESFLGLFNLKNHIITSSSQIVNDISYYLIPEVSYKKLDQLRYDAVQFLSKNL